MKSQMMWAIIAPWGAVANVASTEPLVWAKFFGDYPPSDDTREDAIKNANKDGYTCRQVVVSDPKEGGG